MKPIVYLTRLLPQSILDKLMAEVELRYFPNAEEPIPRAELLRSVAGADGIMSMLTDKIDGEVMRAAGRQLKIIANMAVGFDNIDLDAARKLGVLVTNTPDVLTETTADLVFALLLSTARRLGEAERFLRQGAWQTWSPMLMTGQDVYGRTIGIIGMGRIGEAVARRAKGFGMRVIYHNRTPRRDIEKEHGYEYCSFTDVFREADFVVPLVPLTSDTKQMIGLDELKLMKPSSIFINASRGQVVDETALYQILADKKIWGAGLDVFTQEPIAMNHPFLQLPNVTLLPHIGSASTQTRLTMAMVAIENLMAGLHGRTPKNLLT